MLGTNSSTAKIGGVLALVAIMLLAGPASAASSTLVSMGTGSDFSDKEGSTNGTVSYNSTGVQISETGVYESKTLIDITETPDTLEYNIDSLSTDVQFDVYQNGEVIDSKTVNSTGSGSMDLAVSGSDSIDLAIFVPDDNDGTTGETVTVDSVSFVADNDSPTADFSDSDNAETVVTGDSVTIDASASTDPDGDSFTYSWDTNDDGTYGDKSGGSSITVSESSTGTYTYSVQVSDGSGGTDTANFTLTVNESTGSLEVSGVTDSSGNSISGFDVTVTDSSDNQVDSTTGVSAPYSVSDLTAGSTYDVTVSADGYADITKSFSITENTTTSKSFEMSEFGDLDVTVEDPDGNALDSATVELVDSDGNIVNTVETDTDGSASASVPAGDYTVRATHSQYQTTESDVVSVSDGSSADQTVQMESYRSIDFTVEDADGNAINDATVELKQDGTTVQSVTTSSDIAVTLGEVSDGTYTISVNATDYKSVSESGVEMSSDAQVTATLVPSDSVETSSMTVTTTDTGGGGSGSVPTNNILIIGAFAAIFLVISVFILIQD